MDMKVIYENDIPDLPNNVIYADDLVAERLYYTPNGLERRWKPNGITDNIDRWKRKNYIRKLLNQIEVIRLNAGDITATKMDCNRIKWDEERGLFYAE